VKRVLEWVAALAVLVVAVLVVEGWTSFGRGADGARLARMERSPQWKGGRFENPLPLSNDLWGVLAGSFAISPDASPSRPLPAERIDRARFETPPPSGLRVTWLGHASALVEIDGHRILTDPVWSERASPFRFIGPKRWYTPPIALRDLPRIDAVVVSHEHYDHLDYRTIAAMRDWDTKFVVPLGIGAHLEYWGVPAARIVELDWWERTRVRELDLVCTPARHASGRLVIDDGATLWSGWALLGSRHRAFFSGDTGLFPGMREIGARLGPFDVTMIETGQYHAAWPDWHIGPEQAVVAHGMLRGRVLLPMHWGLFQLAYHGWTEPADRALAAAEQAHVALVVPKPGQSVEPEAPPAVRRWWPEVGWQTAAQAPIVSTRMD